MDQTLRRVAVIGGVRIPFCRSNTFYADQSNLEMLTGHAQRPGRQVRPQGRAHRRGGRRRRRLPLQGLEPGARGRARHQARAHHARHHHPAGLRHQPAGGRHDRRQDRHRPDRERHRHGLRHDVGCADRVQAEVRASPGRGAERQVDGRAALGLQGLLAGASWRRSRPTSASRAPASPWASTPS